MDFTDAELTYLSEHPLGRLATVDADGAPQVSPVGVRYNELLGTLDIIGTHESASRKWRNILTNASVAVVVDDVVSTDPWRPRGIEIRGVALASVETTTDRPRRRELIRVSPRRIISWNLEPDHPSPWARDLRRRRDLAFLEVA